MEATAQGPLKKLTQLVAEMDAANKAIRGQITKALSRLSGTHQEVQALMKALHKGMAGTFHRYGHGHGCGRAHRMQLHLGLGLGYS